jgi:chorismate dehydratase
MTLRIGCVPYLNAKPVIDWFHSPSCDADAEVTYAVPSELAQHLRSGSLDVALVSTVELFRSPGLRVVPDISISADGPVRSVRLFSKKVFGAIESVALDLGSLTSVALTRILLSEVYGVEPKFERHSPELPEMLDEHDAALIIGRLDDFPDQPPYVLDLGAAWKELTGLPFCYAAWLAREDVPAEPMISILNWAKEWGRERRGQLVQHWSAHLGLPVERVAEYLCGVIRYDLGAQEREAIDLFQHKCVRHGIVETPVPVNYYRD